MSAIDDAALSVRQANRITELERQLAVLQTGGKLPTGLKFKIWKAKPRDWRWHLKARNREIVAQGEGYKNKTDAVAAVKLVQASAGAEILFA